MYVHYCLVTLHHIVLCSLKLLAMWLLMTFTRAMTQPTRTAVDWPPQSRRRSPHAVEYVMVCTGLNTLV